MSERETNFASMLHLWRTVNKLTLRDLAAETGIGHATLLRIEQGREMDRATWYALEEWLFRKRFIKP